MNNEWFECKVKYEKTMENGLVKKVTEPYLVDALNFTEAEARIIEEITPFMTGAFEVSDIKRAHYAELFELLAMTAPTSFSVPNCSLSHSTKRVARRRRPRRMCLCRLPICAIRSSALTRV